MVAHDSNMWYTPSWELVPDTTRTDLGTITWSDTFSLFIIY